LIVGVHVAVIGSVVMTQGCASTQRGAASTVPAAVEPAPVPILPPSAAATTLPSMPPVAFPQLQPPTEPAPLPTSVAAENVYVVKSGDSLSKIAVAHGVNARELAELNQIANANKIRAGQKIILPDHAKPSQSQPVAKSPAAPKAAATAGAGEYVVKSGDALSKIAAAHGVKTKDLMAANKISDANKIRAGQKLVIPGAQAAEKKDAAPKAEEAAAAAPAPAPADKPVEPAVAPVPPPVPEPAAAVAPAPAAPAAPAAGQEGLLDYTVQAGDTAESIARLFVVSKDEILRINNIPAGAEVQAGQKIKIPPSSL